MWLSEHRRICAFELWCWRTLLRVPWPARRSNQSILKEISPGCSLEGLMLRLKLQILATWCKGLTRLKRPWCWERLRAGGEGDNRGYNGWMVSPTQWTWIWVNSGRWWWTGRTGCCGSKGSQRVGHDWATELNWTMTSLFPDIAGNSPFLRVKVCVYESIIFRVLYVGNTQGLYHHNRSVLI